MSENNNNSGKAKPLKKTAETIAAVATVVVSGKTIATVVDSGVEGIKALHGEFADEEIAEPLEELKAEEPTQPVTENLGQPAETKVENSAASFANSSASARGETSNVDTAPHYDSSAMSKTPNETVADDHLEVLSSDPLSEESINNAEGEIAEVTEELSDSESSEPVESILADNASQDSTMEGNDPVGSSPEDYMANTIPQDIAPTDDSTDVSTDLAFENTDDMNINVEMI